MLYNLYFSCMFVVSDSAIVPTIDLVVPEIVLLSV